MSDKIARRHRDDDRLVHHSVLIEISSFPANELRTQRSQTLRLHQPSHCIDAELFDRKF